MTQPASIVVLNWDGIQLLQANLPHLLQAVEAAGGGHELIMVDNGSTDGSVAYVNSAFPAIRTIALPLNLGLVRAYNIGSSFASNPVVIHLNNSVRVNPHFLVHLLGHFDNPDVFAVHPKLVADDGTIEAELSFGSFKDRILMPVQPHAYAPDAPYYLAPCYSMYAPGGCSAYCRSKFWLLRGNDEIYSPFHWEESDLSYRAWKRGWTVVFEPRSVGHHMVHATIGRIDPAYSQILYYRNHLLFNWINLTDARMLEEHFSSLGGFIAQDHLHLKGYLEALRFIPNVLSRREWERPHIRFSDREVLATISDNGTGVPNGTFISRQGAVYLIDEGKRRWVPGETMLRAHARAGSTLEVAEDVIGLFDEGQPVDWPCGSILKDSTGSVFLTRKGRRLALDSSETAGLLGVDPKAVPEALSEELTRLPRVKHLDLELSGVSTASHKQFEGIFKLLIGYEE